MPKIVFIEANGKEHPVTVQSGRSLMQAAIDNMIPGIVAECGGSCSCATCHGYLEAPWSERVPPAGAQENSLLEGLLDVALNSRLTCQVEVTDDLDGMVVRLPASQN